MMYTMNEQWEIFWLTAAWACLAIAAWALVTAAFWVLLNASAWRSTRLRESSRTARRVGR